MRLWLWIVQPNPQGWSQGWRWAGVGILMVVVWGVGMGHPVFGTGMSTGCYYSVGYVRQPDASWAVEMWTASDLVITVKFGGGFRYERGLGWERWHAERGVPTVEYNLRPEPKVPVHPSSLLSPAQMEDAWRACFQWEIDHIDQGPLMRECVIACTMLRDDQREVFHGRVVYAAFFVCGRMGLGLIAGSFVIGIARIITRNSGVDRIHRVRDGVCPRCQYPFRAGTKPVCSECGLDIAADDRATRERMGEPVEDVVGPRGEEIDEGVLDASWVDDERVWGGAGGEEGPSGNDSVQGAGR